MRFLLVDLCSIFRPIWEAADKENDLGHSSRATVSRIHQFVEGFDGVAICCDSPTSWRIDTYPAYKANRAPTVPEMKKQLRISQEQLARDGFPVWQVDGNEADDVVASAVKQLPQDAEIVIVTSDKDMMPLVTERVKVMTPRETMGPEQVKAKYGVPPHLMRDWIVLVGDASDNIEGIHGIGKVTASSLLNTHGPLFDIYAKLGDSPAALKLKPSVFAALKEGVHIAELGKKLVTLRDDLPLPIDEILKPRAPTAPEQEFEEEEAPMSDTMDRSKPTAANPFTRATKRQAKLRMAIIGPSGAGKTYTALSIAMGLGGRVAVVDTERGSASKYADDFTFDSLEPDTFAPEVISDAVRAAEEAGYSVCIIDSLSAAWTGKEGALEQVDMATKRSRSQNQFTDGWREVTPMHNRMVDAIVGCKMHIICTMRTKTEYVIEENDRGKKVPRKLGLQPVQRAGLEYEFDVTSDVDMDNNLVIDKTRCKALKGRVFQRAGDDLAGILKAWLTEGAPALEAPLFSSIKAELEKADTLDDLGKAKQRIIRARNERTLTPQDIVALIDHGSRRKDEIEGREKVA